VIITGRGVHDKTPAFIIRPLEPNAFVLLVTEGNSLSEAAVYVAD